MYFKIDVWTSVVILLSHVYISLRRFCCNAWATQTFWSCFKSDRFERFPLSLRTHPKASAWPFLLVSLTGYKSTTIPLRFHSHFQWVLVKKSLKIALLSSVDFCEVLPQTLRIFALRWCRWLAAHGGPFRRWAQRLASRPEMGSFERKKGVVGLGGLLFRVKSGWKLETTKNKDLEEGSLVFKNLDAFEFWGYLNFGGYQWFTFWDVIGRATTWILWARKAADKGFAH